jgi:thymidylate synthase (FAD)
MTQIIDIDFENNPNYNRYLDHGFVGLIDTMGTDSSIVQAARVSYGDGTKNARDDRGLIRYLIKHKHTSPLEMCSLKFHLKMPIFVMRQHVRHRTASLNEYSGRYSEMTDEFYVPDDSQLMPQSQTNKQGSDGEMSDIEKEMCRNTIKRTTDNAWVDYNSLLGNDKEEGGRDYKLTNRSGLSRELSRIILPVNNYTELYWKIDLHNFFHYAKLRKDPHAQWEIQQLATLMYDAVKPQFPVACEAFEDYIEHSVTLSRMEVNLIQKFIDAASLDINLNSYLSDANTAGMSKREITEFKKRFNI